MDANRVAAIRAHPVDVFRWTHGDVVLLVTWEPGVVVVARAWRRGDALTDVRRWRFACMRRAGGQVRRLVRESTGDDCHGLQVMAEFLAWSAASRDESAAPASAAAGTRAT